MKATNKAQVALMLPQPVWQNYFWIVLTLHVQTSAGLKKIHEATNQIYAMWSISASTMKITKVSRDWSSWSNGIFRLLSSRFVSDFLKRTGKVQFSKREKTHIPRLRTFQRTRLAGCHDKTHRYGFGVEYRANQLRRGWRDQQLNQVVAELREKWLRCQNCLNRFTQYAHNSVWSCIFSLFYYAGSKANVLSLSSWYLPFGSPRGIRQKKYLVLIVIGRELRSTVFCFDDSLCHRKWLSL